MDYFDKILEQRIKEGKRIEVIKLPTGGEVTIIGDLNVEVLVKSALAQLS